MFTSAMSKCTLAASMKVTRVGVKFFMGNETSGISVVRVPALLRCGLLDQCPISMHRQQMHEYTGWRRKKWTTVQSENIIYVNCCSAMVSFM